MKRKPLTITRKPLISTRKPLITIILIALSALASPALADEAPEVFINSALITFADQQPVIMGEGYTLVPARGVFEAMGAKVTWDDETKTVEVEKADTLVTLTVGGSVMKVADTANASEKSVALDISPIITEETGRTMIPLRAISEAMGADVKWEDETRTITITTEDSEKERESLPAYTLSSDKTEAAAGDTVDIYIEASSLPEGGFISCVTATLLYDTEHFEFTEAQLVNGTESVDKVTSGVNTKLNDRLKAVFVMVDPLSAAAKDGKALKLTFRSVDGKGGKFSLANGYNTELGYDTSLRIDKADESGSVTSSTLYEGVNLNVDTAALTVNGAK